MKASTSDTISHQAKLLSSVNNELLCCLDCSGLWFHQRSAVLPEHQLAFESDSP